MKNKTTLFIILSLTFIYIGYTQNNTDFFKKYSKLSLTIGYDRFNAKTELTPTIPGLTYRYMPYNTGHFGLNYDVLQTKKFNFKVGITAVRHREIERVSMDNSLISFDVPGGFEMTTETSYDFLGIWQIDVPLTAEYLFSLNKTIKLSIGSSLVIGFQDDGGGEGGFGIEDEDLSTDFFYTMVRPGDPLYFNARLETGFYFTLDKLMIKTNFFYNYAFQNLYEGNYLLYNATIPDVKGTYKEKGNYFGAEISIYLLKRKKK
jgi:hypothetical protein